jgi:hypothetical protein
MGRYVLSATSDNKLMNIYYGIRYKSRVEFLNNDATAAFSALLHPTMSIVAW